jgi:hypothetical protein
MADVTPEKTKKIIFHPQLLTTERRITGQFNSNTTAIGFNP